MNRPVVFVVFVILILSLGCSSPKTTTTQVEPSEPADVTAPEPEPAYQELVEEESIITPEIADYCSGALAEDDVVCVDGDADDQISREAIGLVGDITDSQKSRFFDGNSFFMEEKDMKYKVTLRSSGHGSFALSAVPEHELGLCGLEFVMKDGIYEVKFNPGNSGLSFSDAEHCLADCGVEMVSDVEPSFDQQSCMLDCGIKVCQS